MNLQTRSYRQRLRATTTHLRSILEAIDERTARADASTIAPRHTPTERIDTSGYADPTLNTVGERDQLLGQVETDLWKAEKIMHQAASRLALYTPNPPADDRCTCTRHCCPDGCSRIVTDGGKEHPTCRSKRAKARRRGAPWALTEDTVDS